mmetsp:Transcript_15912/g.20137  ORF Transcript_15912/g.20137 Transcript_15912/m.20137 type:complete len:297 (+) Transcript_15912:312-1202(+)
MCNLLVITLGKLRVLSILLGLHASLPLLKSKLGLPLERLIRRKVLLLGRRRILPDSLMHTLIKLLQTIRFYVLGNVASKLLLVLLVIFLLQVLHVLTNVSSKDTLLVHISIIILAITIVSGETLLRVRNVKSTICGTLESTKNTASSGSSLAPNIEESAEGTLVLINLIHKVSFLVPLSLDHFSIHLRVSLIHIVQTNLLQQTPRTEQSGAVRSSVVLQSNLESVPTQLGGCSGSQNAIAIDERVGDLTNNLTVGKSNDETVLGGLVLVLGLGAETFALAVIGFTFATTAVFHLVA